MPPKVVISNVPKLSLGQIVRLTPKEVQMRGMRTCSVRIKGVKVELDDFGASKIVQSTSLCIRETHESTIRFFHETGRMPTSLNELRELQQNVPTGNDLWNKPVWVSCDCEWFLYTCEVALSKFGCTNIIHSNGSFPIVRNPNSVPMVCKHLVALAPLAIKHGKEVLPTQFSSDTYPMRPGRQPNVLKDLLRKKRLTPTEEEVGEAMDFVKDYI